MLDGRYRVDALIAVGGMATVYRALDTRLDRVVALKVMHPELAADASFVERFIREARSVARLSHPNVVGVFDQGAEGAYVYLAMEYVPGCTLRDVLRERGALTPRAALDVLEPVLAALGAAHRAGFVHRDMKPENVLIGDDGRVKVADFGLVKAVDTVTNTTGAVLGTVSYLAPEQIEQDDVADARVDVYACGVVLYEMLTGGRPHSGDSPAQVLYRHLNEDVPPPSAAVPHLGPELDRLVAVATSRAPEGRPEDAVALLALTRDARAALDDAALDAVPPAALEGDRSIAEDRTSVIPRFSTPTRPADDDGVQRTSVLAAAPPEPPAPAPRRRLGNRRKGGLAALVAVLLVLCVGAGVWYINSGQFTRVPPLLAKTEDEARQRLADAGLKVGGVDKAYSDTADRGTVTKTDPGTGERVRGNGSVNLTVSLGPRKVTVPRVEGMALDKAKARLRDAGLEPGMVTRAFSDSVAKGEVVSTDPSAGTERRGGSAVALVVSKGAPVEVPDVAGSSLQEATEALKEAGLKVSTADERIFSEHEKGAVAAQSPKPGTELAEGGEVELTLSKGPDLVEVPDVTGQKEDEARKTLEGAGFKVDVSRWFFGDTVWDQSVEGGETAPRGSEITIRVR
ncbi:Stk1 family PASTA domain-containing Ser/Thr kinase [Streptomyces albidoflavus]|uniref:Stk1 family PASTA domain-containing Ser/Thr kinase n=1 Tax=Streptomyces TaxID=1883 RepID=UPI000282E873|nr:MULTISPECIES: Stk1 family PASTA domain-containing Ser/Thr kinase [Streptomyces]AMM11483.1 serine/threonine-protein kinase pknL [Streptomyces albidoflavus]MCX4443392.1 Stk1 family PASTA domain-containing Ser/Thr kinase [Streptomyces albidoflavus]PKA38571.1 serine/threonine protein kinase [Streptomyces sp. SM8]RZE58757.1 serine/threonine protein kinase [Streptomyces albidoflavus]RZE70718.1 serine/threonine protein kinase [Streptomyces albidoflavus]